jgi:hypothetical protein
MLLSPATPKHGELHISPGFGELLLLFGMHLVRLASDGMAPTQNFQSGSIEAGGHGLCGIGSQPELHWSLTGVILVLQNVWFGSSAPHGIAGAGAVEVEAILVSTALHLLLTPGGGSGGWAATMPVSNAHAAHAAISVNFIATRSISDASN